MLLKFKDSKRHLVMNMFDKIPDGLLSATIVSTDAVYSGTIEESELEHSIYASHELYDADAKPALNRIERVNDAILYGSSCIDGSSRGIKVALNKNWMTRDIKYTAAFIAGSNTGQLPAVMRVMEILDVDNDELKEGCEVLRDKLTELIEYIDSQDS
jgi:hypothetical protein